MLLHEKYAEIFENVKNANIHTITLHDICHEIDLEVNKSFNEKKFKKFTQVKAQYLLNLH